MSRTDENPYPSPDEPEFQKKFRAFILQRVLERHEAQPSPKTFPFEILPSEKPTSLPSIHTLNSEEPPSIPPVGAIHDELKNTIMKEKDNMDAFTSLSPQPDLIYVDHFTDMFPGVVVMWISKSGLKSLNIVQVVCGFIFTSGPQFSTRGIKLQLDGCYLQGERQGNENMALCVESSPGQKPGICQG
ncbi:hypothetical protein FGSG_07658 [Fusarium graminearum PH-1]|uniref:Chromosome 4, complete genome n=1 Tax=Gibberella zeae (strain ATCC MYA-4620 / CBS 123657 / FGSC 9075 / NRRL 31084 / PH-1) TaxID=229533 RepID=I1RTY8_GIBZE|nr:hypothetical protein FGSG_07658 [Fusarium graminearum PH-1]ESU13942.1 hypothetical protein FGSG_07658 [Fusarium graminearum PH-1]EYB30237.1 hypothetical protein FG05_07658 [Fusarium graminearum]CEF85183.1 unnamed protein product [Fusarium graminearum]|eukprot:XP_011327449.1 hypothetical protein FGSG_07658 [Fusarium graminearum PH-1]